MLTAERWRHSWPRSVWGPLSAWWPPCRLGTGSSLINSHQSLGAPESNKPALKATLGPKGSGSEGHHGEGPIRPTCPTPLTPVHSWGKAGSVDFPEVCQHVGSRAEIALGPLLPTLQPPGSPTGGREQQDGGFR